MSAFFLAAAMGGALAQTHDIDSGVEALLQRMTVSEKVGQLTQYSGDWRATGPITLKGDISADIRAGKVGAMLNVLGTRYTRQYQDEAMQSRLKIPLLFGQDVVHGYKTTFPIPLAESASWDLEAIGLSARIAATEAAASGIHWVFAPMVDIARDPRWGRVLEGAGEDPYLGARIAAARVQGFQGQGLGRTDTVMATAKHFAAYGAATAGRDYNSVDMSARQLLEVYLPPFKAAVDAGVATFMNAFNDVNGIPAAANRYLHRQLLKGQWGFTGFVVSDWGSIGELVAHGYAEDPRAAALAAIAAGTDMDMESNAYRQHLGDLLAAQKVPLALVDDAVRRILRKKFELGLFDDPYKYADAQREQRALNNPVHPRAARAMAGKSIVLLKNEGGLLPLSKSVKTIAFIGPLVKAVGDNQGAWAIDLPEVDYAKLIVTQWDGVQTRAGPQTRLLYAKGCEVEGDSKDGFAQALEVARQADVVILSVGEHRGMSGEAASRTRLNLPGVQEDLIKALHATGKPMVVLINAGRPLLFDWTADHATAVLYTWWLGSEAGHAIADVLFGDVNPSAKLPLTFPRNEGQIPIYYNHLNTGRPPPSDDSKGFTSSYRDALASPKYAFGHGLSYTTFHYDNLQLNRQTMAANGRIEVTLTVANTGPVAGAEVVQLYLRDRVASVVRPVQELKDFQKITLAAGEEKAVRFSIDKEKLSFFNEALHWVAEPGEFELMVGSSSADIRLRARFALVE